MFVRLINDAFRLFYATFKAEKILICPLKGKCLGGKLWSLGGSFPLFPYPTLLHWMKPDHPYDKHDITYRGWNKPGYISNMCGWDSLRREELGIVGAIFQSSILLLWLSSILYYSSTKDQASCMSQSTFHCMFLQA